MIRMLDFAIQLSEDGGTISALRGRSPSHYANLFQETDTASYPLNGFFDSERHLKFSSFVKDVLSERLDDWNEFKFRWYPAVHHMMAHLEKLISPKWNPQDEK